MMEDDDDVDGGGDGEDDGDVDGGDNGEDDGCDQMVKMMVMEIEIGGKMNSNHRLLFTKQ